MKKIVLTCCAYFLVVFPLFSQQKVLDWLGNNAVPIQSVEADTGLDDLMAMKTFFQEVKLVGMGEATHGTRDFFKLKHRLIEFFAKEMGFTFIAAEVPFSEALLINEYVLIGVGDPVELLKGVYYWMWQTQETLELVEWMRTYNSALPMAKRVKFYGLDMAVSKGAAASLITFLEKVDPNTLLLYFPALKALENENSFDYMQLPKTRQLEIFSQIKDLKTYLNHNRQTYLSNVTAREFDLLYRQVEVLVQYLEYHNPEESNQKHSRDYYMAENAKWLLDYEGTDSKGILWAHNGHIEKHQLSPGKPSMGNYLVHKLGKWYYSLGTDFNQGGFLAVNNGLKSMSVGPVRKNSTGHLYSQFPSKLFFYDFAHAEENSDMEKFMNNGIWMRDIPATFEPRQEKVFYVKRVLSESFDGIVFIDSTSSATPFPSVSQPFLNLSKSTNAKRHRGKTFTIQADASVTGPIACEVWIHITNRHNVPVYRKIINVVETQNQIVIEDNVPDEAMLISYGLTARGSGELSLNGLKLLLNQKVIDEEESGFEKREPDGYPLGWRVNCRGCCFQWPEDTREDLLKIRLGD